jgi:hypothetical protein
MSTSKKKDQVMCVNNNFASFCMGVKHGPLLSEKDMNYKCLEMKCSGKYLDQRRME